MVGCLLVLDAVDLHEFATHAQQTQPGFRGSQLEFDGDLGTQRHGLVGDGSRVAKVPSRVSLDGRGVHELESGQRKSADDPDSPEGLGVGLGALADGAGGQVVGDAAPVAALSALEGLARNEDLKGPFVHHDVF